MLSLLIVRSLLSLLIERSFAVAVDCEIIAVAVDCEIIAVAVDCEILAVAVDCEILAVAVDCVTTAGHKQRFAPSQPCPVWYLTSLPIFRTEVRPLPSVTMTPSLTPAVSRRPKSSRAMSPLVCGTCRLCGVMVTDLALSLLPSLSLFGLNKILFTHRNHKLNKQVQETQKQYAYLSVTYI